MGKDGKKYIFYFNFFYVLKLYRPMSRFFENIFTWKSSLKMLKKSLIRPLTKTLHDIRKWELWIVTHRQTNRHTHRQTWRLYDWVGSVGRFSENYESDIPHYLFFIPTFSSHRQTIYSLHKLYIYSQSGCSRKGQAVPLYLVLWFGN